MNYAVFQINLTNEQVNEVNTSKDYPAFYKAYLDTTFRPTQESVLAARGMYEQVAVIEAADLEGVFHIGNMGPEEKITRLAPMHSVSVGDVVVDEDGNAFVVASFGFDPIVGF